MALTIAFAARAADDKLPKMPDKPLAVAVLVEPRPAPADEKEAKIQKEIGDSRRDVQDSFRNKRKTWFTLVDDPADAEVLLEIKARGWEQGHGAVVEGRAYVLDGEPFRIIGQGALGPNGSLHYWREAAADMTGRLETYCRQTYAHVLDARRKGVRPLAVRANDAGVDKLDANDLPGALQAFDEAIRQAPAYALAFYNRGVLHSKRKEWDAALADFQEALRLEPDVKHGHFARARVHEQLDDWAGARADLDEAMKQDPRDAASLRERGVVLGRLGEYAPALADLNRSIVLDPARKGVAFAGRAMVEEAQGQHAQALADYDGALHAGYDTAPLQYGRGLIMKALGNDAGACAAFKAAVRLDATDPDALFERGLCSARHQDLAHAVADFSECVRLKPDMAVAYLNRGICYGKQGQAKLAAADRAKALSLDPKLAKK